MFRIKYADYDFFYIIYISLKCAPIDKSLNPSGSIVWRGKLNILIYAGVIIPSA